MSLPCRLRLSRRDVKGKAVLALDTGYDADSIEGLRLVKASRGSGWLFHRGRLTPWNTQGVLQDEGRLVVWGELDAPEGTTPDSWPLSPGFLRAFAAAWTSRGSDLGGFGPASAVPLAVGDAWAFAFLPPELAAVLDSLQPLPERRQWEGVRHPDLTGASSWAFTTAALSIMAAGPLPWEQDDEESLRQEVRELKKTLKDAELPDAAAGTRRLWLESLQGRGSPAPWAAWASSPESPLEPSAERRRNALAAAARRSARRRRGRFWRRRGTLVTLISGASLAVLAVAASVVWNAIKPDPTDTWTPEQVVRGYYQALSSLDSVQLRKLTAFDRFREPILVADLDQASALYVLRQVRTAYEKENPIYEAAQWEAEGKPAIRAGRQLYGLTGLTIEGSGARWAARYRKWVSESGVGELAAVSGAVISDRLELVPTGRGWKVSSLTRESQPLP